MRCSKCKEELPDNIWEIGDTIYCVGIHPPHDHYLGYGEATDHAVEEEIQEAEVIK